MEQYDQALPGYQIVAQLYQSDYTAVCRAIRLHDHQPVILKILKRAFAPPLALARYHHEYDIMCNLNAAGVIKVYGLEVYGDWLVLIVEDVGGVPLQEVMQAWRQVGAEAWPLSQLIDLARQIVTALAEIHAAGIIHKDVNPSNIVLNPETGVVKIIDFDLATTLSRENPPCTTGSCSREP